MTNNRSTYMQFDFTRDDSNTEPLLFTKPIKMIITRDAADVPDCFRKIDEAIEAGFYAAGYISYEALHAPDELPKKTANELPLVAFGIFEEPGAKSYVPEIDAFQIGKWQMLESKRIYEENFAKIQNAIQRDEIEEINYTVPFEASFTGNAFRYYEQLREAQASNYCVYLSIDGFDILSASPELFFQMEQREITVRPMKGTIHRGLTYEEDIRHKEWLRTSRKNKLENKLTLDLMEKELEKVTIPGSIHRIDPFRVEKYPTVYQMTSGLTGTINPDRSVMNIMEALFPCGSIAGVPKTTGLRLIRELEDRPREVYCGAIGYITPEKDAIFNVPIRTVWIDHDKNIAHYSAGGAITSHSTAEGEYYEVQTKTDVLTWKQPDFELLETFGLYNGTYIVFDEHIKRLYQSADYFDIPIVLSEIKDKLEQERIANPNGSWRVRLTVSQDGTSNITILPLIETEAIQSVRLASSPINKHNCYVYHKTTNRSHYEVHKQGQEDVFDVLLWNKEREVTEFTIGNLVAEIGGILYTPPVSSGLLPGTFRAKLLENETIKERRMLIKDIKACDRLWLINSLRKWVELKMN